MENNRLSVNQAVFSIVLFNFGSSVVMGISTCLAQDTLLAIFTATLFALPLFLIFARIMKLFPEQDIFEIIETLFGKVLGKLIIALLAFYAIHLAALVLRNFTEFTQVSMMEKTPQLPIIILMGLTAIYLARSNIHAIGKWAVLCFFLVLFVVMITFSASLRHIRLDDILPLAEHPPKQIFQNSLQIFSFPYGETVIFLSVASAFPKGKSHHVFLKALIIILIIFLLVFLRNLVLLGQKMMEASLFPSYVTVRITEISDFVTRFEGLISSNFILAGIVKISLCLLAAAKGVMALFQLDGHKAFVLPCGILAMALCAILFKSLM
ncbi:MAG: endospore germination permease, partial [Clostridiales bacterium]|nr:endospore germination permease [Clostridiales bacterium]